MDTPSVNHFRSLQINNNGVRIFEDSNGFCKVDNLHFVGGAEESDMEARDAFWANGNVNMRS